MIRNPTMQHGTFLCMQRHNPLPSWGIAECTAEPAQSEENSPDYKETSNFFGVSRLRQIEGCVFEMTEARRALKTQGALMDPPGLAPQRL